eukprot:364027-Chlamydomonas_euryale.AAC.9
MHNTCSATALSHTCCPCTRLVHETQHLHSPAASSFPRSSGGSGSDTTSWRGARGRMPPPPALRRTGGAPRAAAAWTPPSRVPSSRRVGVPGNPGDSESRLPRSTGRKAARHAAVALASGVSEPAARELECDRGRAVTACTAFPHAASDTSGERGPSPQLSTAVCRVHRRRGCAHVSQASACPHRHVSTGVQGFPKVPLDAGHLLKNMREAGHCPLQVTSKAPSAIPQWDRTEADGRCCAQPCIHTCMRGYPCFLSSLRFTDATPNIL